MALKGILKYFDRHFGLEEKGVKPYEELTLKERLVHYQILELNADKIQQTIKTKGWEVIEKVLVGSILNWRRMLETASSDEVKELQRSIRDFKEFLAHINGVEISAIECRIDLEETLQDEDLQEVLKSEGIPS